MRESWRRHDLLCVEPEAWSRILESRPPLAKLPHVAGWAKLGWPLIVRRRTKEDDPGMIPVGLPLPPNCGKLRLSAQVGPEEIVERVAPQTLRTVRSDTPLLWRSTVDALLQLADQSGVEPCVFGSLLWQRLTGLPYLSAASDLDLLWPATEAGSAAHLVHRLAFIEKESPVRFDGEIILPDGGGVQWREWYGNPSEVLVKGADDVQLRAVRDCFPAPAFAS